MYAGLWGRVAHGKFEDVKQDISVLISDRIRAAVLKAGLDAFNSNEPGSNLQRMDRAYIAMRIAEKKV